MFWWVMAVFIVGAMIMNGRHKLDAFGMTLIAFHMGAIGLVVALILVMDSPFRRRNERLTGFAGEGCAAVFTVVQLSKSSPLRLWESLSQDAPGLLSTSWAQHLIIGSFSNRTPANTAGVFGSVTSP